MEWCRDVEHPVEANRGHRGSGDACSPGWFEIPMEPAEAATIIVSAEANPSPKSKFIDPTTVCSFSDRLSAALQSFVVQRGSGKTVIAG